jgi:hypothetical protein
MHQVTDPYSPTVPSGQILVPKYLQSRKVSTAYLWNMAHISHCAWDVTKGLAAHKSTPIHVVWEGSQTTWIGVDLCAAKQSLKH